MVSDTEGEQGVTSSSSTFFDIAAEHRTLDTGADGHHFIRFTPFVGFLTEEFLYDLPKILGMR